MSGSHRFHIASERPPFTKEFANWLLTQTRVLAIRLLMQLIKKSLSSHFLRWRVKTALEKSKGPRKSLTRTVAKCRSSAVLKLKAKAPHSPPESKSNAASPDSSFKKLDISSTLRVGFHSKPAAAAPVTVSVNPTPRTDPRPKRPSSLPPGRDEATVRIEEPVSTFHLGDKSGLIKQRSPSNAVDVGTRLFRKAQEMETRKEALRKIMEPGYPFQPQLSQDPEKWLKQKSAKTTPVKPRGDPEEIAVVSSVNALSSLSKIVEMVSPTNKSSLKLPRSRTTTSIKLTEEEAGRKLFIREASGYKIAVQDSEKTGDVMVDVVGEDTAEAEA